MAFISFDVFHCYIFPEVNKYVRCRFPLEQELLQSLSIDECSQFLDQNRSVYAYVVHQFFHYSPVCLSPRLGPWPAVLRLSVLQDSLENSLLDAYPVHSNAIAESVRL